jgi:hypothetical protein
MRRFIVAGSALASILVLRAGGQARTAATTISIHAKTSWKPFDHLIIDTWGRPAVISGAIGSKLSGAQVQLQASTFPFNAGYAAIAQSTTAAGGSYSFTARPTLATRYRVVLVSDPASQSRVLTIFVAPRALNVSRGGCRPAPRCRRHFAADFVYPPAVVKQESAKPSYFYFGIHYGSRSEPKRLRLVKAGPQRYVGRGRYQSAFTITFSTPTSRYRYEWIVCGKDTEAADGLGLPGHHHCGDRSIRWADVLKGWIG